MTVSRIQYTLATPETKAKTRAIKATLVKDPFRPASCNATMTGTKAIQARGHQSKLGMLRKMNRAEQRASPNPAMGDVTWKRCSRTMEVVSSGIHGSFYVTEINTQSGRLST